MGLVLMGFVCARTPSPAQAPPPAGAETLSPAFEPTATAEAAKTVVKRRSGQGRHRYERERAPKLGGRVGLSLVVDAGRVSSAWPSMNTSGDDVLAACIVTRALSWRVSERTGGELSYPQAPAPSTRSEVSRG